ncbi:MAG: choice-of-anchor J domain-containing protein, partial [Muribaculaceae bacterium]|nr:choice-of-anchor J domain-containing protein [Muribaculaceae bacterium]
MKKFLTISCLTAAGLAGMATILPSGMQSPPSSKGHERFMELKNVPGARALTQYSRDIEPTQSVIYRAPEHQGGFPVIYANIVYDSNWLDITDYEKVPFGIYTFEASQNPDPKGIVTSSELEGNAGAILDGKYYFIVPQIEQTGQTSGGTMYVYDINTWSLSGRQQFDIDSNAGAIAFQMATDHNAGIIYSISYNDDATGFVFGTFDPQTLKRKIIGKSDYMHALAVDNDGTVYGINVDSELVRFDKNTGEQTVIGPTGVEIAYNKQSGTIDPQSGIFYWAAYCGGNKESLYMVDKSSGRATKVGDFPNSKEMVAMAIAPDNVESGAPARTREIKLDVNQAELNGTISFTAPDKTFGGQALSGELEALVDIDGAEFKREKIQAGASKTVEINVAAPGLHSIAVRFVNEVGAGPSNAISYYFGADAPGAVVEPMLTNENGVATLVWDAPETGMHGGYIDSTTFSYKVFRVTYEGEVEVASSLKETEFSEKIDTDKILAVRYRIVPYAGELEGVASVTDKAIFGDAFSAPVTWMLDDPDEFEMFTAIDANGDGFSWESGTWRYTQNKTIYAQNMWNDDDKTDADDWFVSPKVRLEPGRRYYFKFSAANTMMTKQETFEVMMGTEPTIDGLSTRIQEPVTISCSDEWQRQRIPVEVSEAGTYNFGIHCISKAPDYYRLYIDTIAVEAGPRYKAPAKVENFKITPAEKAGMSARLSFRLPTKAVDGTELKEITKVLIYRGDRNSVEPIATLTDNLTPGSEIEYNDESPANWFNTWRVAAVNSDGEGEYVEDEAYVGLDKPSKLDAINVAVGKDDVVLNWNPASETGVNGGYVDPAKVSYNVYDGIQFQYRIRGLQETSFSVGDPEEGTPHSQFWLVCASNDKGQGESVVSSRYIHGKSYSLPFREEFTNGRTDNTYWFAGESNPMASSAWRLGVDENKNGVMQYYGQPGAYNSIYPAPLDLSEASHPVLTFESFRNTNSSGDRLSIWASAGTVKDFVKVTDIELSSTPNVFTVDLSAFAGKPRVCISFNCESASKNAAIFFDNISVYDQKGEDLGIAEVSAPDEINYNDQAKIKATVANYGATTAEDYSVNLYKDGKTLVESKQGTALKSGARAEYEFDYPASITDPENISFHVEIDFAGDSNPDNDASDAFSIKVRKPMVPAVDDLSLETTGGERKLVWSRPAYADGTPAMEVTDGVEDYIDFAISNIGGWTMIDGDGKYTYSLGGVSPYHNQYGPAAFQVFNPTKLGISAQSNMG